MDDPTLVCPVCGHKYVPQGFRCRVTTYRKDGSRRDECLQCGVAREKEEEKVKAARGEAA